MLASAKFNVTAWIPWHWLGLATHCDTHSALLTGTARVPTLGEIRSGTYAIIVPRRFEREGRAIAFPVNPVSGPGFNRHCCCIFNSVRFVDKNQVRCESRSLYFHFFSIFIFFISPVYVATSGQWPVTGQKLFDCGPH